MKIKLDIPDNKADSLLDVLRSISYVKAIDIIDNKAIEKTNSLFKVHEIESILNFFYCQSKLEYLDVSRSTNSICDIAEFICSKYFKITLCKSQRNEGFDAFGNNNEKSRIQIKINNSNKGTNQNIGNPEKYHYLYLLVTSNSLLFNNKFTDSFIVIYKIDSIDLRGMQTIAKTFLSKHNPIMKLNSKLEKILYG